MKTIKPREVCAAETVRCRSLMVLGAGCVGLALLFGVVGCAPPPGPQAAQSSAPSPPAPSQMTLPATLSADPRFTDLVHVIEASGQWQTFADAHDVTMLAPTDAAFHSSDADWGAVLTGDGDKAIAKRKTFLKPLLIQGIHPSSEFAGKTQDVRSVKGDVLHMDGRTPGTIIITFGPGSQKGIGFRKQVVRTSRMELPPLVTTSGLIYPVDTIIIQ